MHWFRWLLRRLRNAARENGWLVPLLGALLGLAFALAIGTRGDSAARGWTVTVDRSRDTLFGMLTLVFTSMSIVLALASVAAQNVVGRFGSRTLRLYLRRSPERWLIGSFALTAAFIMSQQFQLRTLDPDDPAPAIGMVVSVVLLVVTSCIVVSYISTIVRWFRVDRAAIVLRRAVLEAVRAVARTGRTENGPANIPERPSSAADLVAPRSGYLAEVDAEGLLSVCRPLGAAVAITEPLGSAVVESQTIGWIAVPEGAIGSIPRRRIAEVVDVSVTRELGRYIEYGLVGMVDIAVIALSPAVNDPNTAVEVIEEIAMLLRSIPPTEMGAYRVSDDDTGASVVVAARSFGELVDLATTQIVLYGADDPMVLRSLRLLSDSLRIQTLSDEDRRHVARFERSLPADNGFDTTAD
jgi:uncharacterized membrane protein